MSTEKPMCRYAIVLHTVELCGHYSQENAPPCSKENCTMYKRLM